MRALERIYRRKTPVDAVVTLELGTTLCQISRETGRQVGVLIDRRGKVEYVIAGSQSDIVIPALSRARIGSGRLKGLRLIHTHLKNEPLSRDDLNDLLLLRLDFIMAIGVGPEGQPQTAYTAGIAPSGGKEPWNRLEPVSFGAFSINFDEFIHDLETELARLDTRKEETDALRAVLVHISALPKHEADERLFELSELARTERIIAVDQITYRGEIHPQSLVGTGRLKDLLIHAMGLNADMILFDQELSPAQQRWIGAFTDMPLLDRTQLILRIFARRAFSTDGKLRVELARLKYLLPRLGAKDDALSRIRGGIGMRGPGETTMEISRRRLKDRIHAMENQLDKLGHGREQRRSLRKKSGIPQVAVIGYTNAGKSTLLNAITKSSVLVEDKLFATLDPTTRRVRFPGDTEIVLSDTVGFIRDLPDDLLDAFRSTLEELRDADILAHLVDISAQDFASEIKTVDEVLGKLELDRIPRLLVFNKIDKVSPELVENQLQRYGAIGISAEKRIGLEKFTELISSELEKLGAGKFIVDRQ